MFSLTADQQVKLAQWHLDQKESISGQPTGASGGVYTYSFTPTTLGTVVKVRNNVSGEEIDLTDYSGW